MAKKFQTLGVMIDLSRNAVKNLKTIKNFMTIIKKMGYNSVFLYMEDTYQVDGEPYFGYMRGAYTKEELKEIDEFGAKLGMEVIPCIQTLAHIFTFKRWNKVQFDYDDILLTDDDRTYVLIENMFKTLKECFRTNRIHVGMDEAHMLGRGKHLDIHGYQTSTEVIARHLTKVSEIATAKGYEILVWSDMFIRSWCNGNYYPQNPGTLTVPKEVRDAIPNGVIPVYWDYYHLDAEHYTGMIKLHKQLAPETWFAGGIWSWEGHLPMNGYTFDTMGPALKACFENKVKNIMMTMWGDDGGECSLFSLLPGLIFVAEYAKGNFDMEKIKAKFKRIVGMDFDDFMVLDKPNSLIELPKKQPVNPAKHMLYSDYFNGFLDYTVVEGGNKLYEGFAEELFAIAKKTRRYKSVFEVAANICSILSIKYELGIITRKAYREGNKEELLRLAKEEYIELLKRIKRFYKTYRNFWYEENKTSGFDVQDIRLGGLIKRTESCLERLIDYANGKVEKIEELECDILPYGHKGIPCLMNSYTRYASCNVMTHYL